MRVERCVWWGIPVKTSAPVRKLTSALTGLTGCASLSAVAFLWDEMHLVFECAALASLQSEYFIDIGSVSGT